MLLSFADPAFASPLKLLVRGAGAGPIFIGR
jgi:hypothetical protein